MKAPKYFLYVVLSALMMASMPHSLFSMQSTSRSKWYPAGAVIFSALSCAWGYRAYKIHQTTQQLQKVRSIQDGLSFLMFVHISMGGRILGKKAITEVTSDEVAQKCFEAIQSLMRAGLERNLAYDILRHWKGYYWDPPYDVGLITSQTTRGEHYNELAAKVQDARFKLQFLKNENDTYDRSYAYKDHSLRNCVIAGVAAAALWYKTAQR